jgi:hypothetical protein
MDPAAVKPMLNSSNGVAKKFVAKIVKRLNASHQANRIAPYLLISSVKKSREAGKAR